MHVVSIENSGLCRTYNESKDASNVMTAGPVFRAIVSTSALARTKHLCAFLRVHAVDTRRYYIYQPAQDLDTYNAVLHRSKIFALYSAISILPTYSLA